MKALIVHLSDLHIESDTDDCLKKREPVVAAVRNLEPEADLLLLIVSGDLSNEGRADQLLTGVTFVEQIRSDLANEIGGGRENFSTKVICAPGNHDCDFSGDATLRGYVVGGGLRKPNKGVRQ